MSEEPILTLTAEEDACIVRIWKASDVLYHEAKQLGESLAKNETFVSRYGNPPTYDAVKNDPELKKFLTSKIILCLPKEFASSKYGVVSFSQTNRTEVATDFDLAQMNKALLEKRCASINAQVSVFSAVDKRRTTLKKKIFGIVNDIINAFEFEGTPPPKSTIKTPDQMKKANDEQLRKLTVSFSVSFFLLI